MYLGNSLKALKAVRPPLEKLLYALNKLGLSPDTAAQRALVRGWIGEIQHQTPSTAVLALRCYLKRGVNYNHRRAFLPYRKKTLLNNLHQEYHALRQASLKLNSDVITALKHWLQKGSVGDSKILGVQAASFFASITTQHYARGAEPINNVTIRGFEFHYRLWPLDGQLIIMPEKLRQVNFNSSGFPVTVSEMFRKVRAAGDNVNRGALVLWTPNGLLPDPTGQRGVVDKSLQDCLPPDGLVAAMQPHFTAYSAKLGSQATLGNQAVPARGRLAQLSDRVAS